VVYTTGQQRPSVVACVCVSSLLLELLLFPSLLLKFRVELMSIEAFSFSEDLSASRVEKELDLCGYPSRSRKPLAVFTHKEPARCTFGTS
jgi:hypothetical protein